MPRTHCPGPYFLALFYFYGRYSLLPIQCVLVGVGGWGGPAALFISTSRNLWPSTVHCCLCSSSTKSPLCKPSRQPAGRGFSPTLCPRPCSRSERSVLARTALCRLWPPAQLGDRHVSGSFLRIVCGARLDPSHRAPPVLGWTPTGTGMLALGVRPSVIWEQGWETQMAPYPPVSCCPCPFPAPAVRAEWEGGVSACPPRLPGREEAL